MAVKILIRRTFKNATTKDVSAMLIQARKNAMNQKGYVSSETLTSDEDPSTVLVLSMWHSKEDWEAYKNSPARMENERKFNEVLAGDTSYEIFHMGLME